MPAVNLPEQTHLISLAQRRAFMGIRTRLARRHRPNTLDTVKGEQIKSNRQPDCIVVIAECKTHPNQIRFNPSKRS